MSRLNPEESFEALKANVQDSIKSSFPQEGERHILDIEDVEITDKQSSGDYTGQKSAKLGGRTFGVPVHATMVLKDKATGKVIDRQRQKLATLPKVTNRYSYIVDGSEFQVDNQWRLKPGVYTKVKQNGELDSFFNIKGRPLHVGFDPKARSFNIQHGGAKPPLYPIMKAMGVSDDTLEATWGKEILEANRTDSRGRPLNVEKSAIAFAKRLDPRATVDDYDQASTVIRQTLEQNALSPDVTKRTLGKPIDHINSEAVLLSSKRLLGVARGTEEPDTRDSLMFKDFHGIEDFVAERIQGHQKVISRRIGNNLDRKDTIKEIVSPDTFNRPIKEFFGKVSLASTPPQTNPLRMISGQMRTTIAGEGGVADSNRITEEAKLVDPSHFGVLDPLHTPESGSTGVSLQMAVGAKKQGHKLLIPLINVKTGKREMVDTEKVSDSIVALPDSVQKIGNRYVPKEGNSVLASTAGNQMRPVKMKDVQYVVPKSAQMFSLATNMVPFINSDSPNRATMAGRHMEQAIPVEDGEEPLVQSVIGRRAMDDLIGNFSSQHTPVEGKVIAVGEDSITVRGANRKKTEVPIYNNYPLNDKKGFMHSRPTVKVGEVVKAGQLVADTNFTQKGMYAPGKNLLVGYTPWKGLNFEDGVVISESAAQKMTSAHMYKKGLSTRDATLDGKKKYQAYYPDRMNKEQFEKLDKDGIIQIGQKVKPGDTLVAALADQQLTTEQQKLRLLHKSLVQPKKDKAVVWEEDYEGEVVGISRQRSNIEVHIKTREPMEVGDKLVGRHGNKGICLSPDNHLLCGQGWVPIADVTEYDLVCTLNPETHEIEYQRPTRIINQHHQGRMYLYEGRRLSLCTTPEHNLYARTRRGAYRLESAESCFGKPRLHLRAGTWLGEDKEKAEIGPYVFAMGDFLRFFGFWIADGCVTTTRHGSIHLCQRRAVNPDIYAEMMASIEALGLGCHVGQGKDALTFTDHDLYNWLSQFGKAREKFIPRWMLELPKHRLQILAEQLFKTDGMIYHDGRHNHTRFELFTSSVRLADDYQELALKMGYSANIRNPKKGAPEEHVVRWTFKDEVWTNNDKRYSNESWMDYDGPVHCVEVPNHVIYIRRNGVPVWCGNCTSILPDAEMPKKRDGTPLEILMNPIGTPGRMNVGQVLETAASKVAERQGKPFRIENFSQTDNLSFVQDALTKEGLSDKEDLIDPSTGKAIPGIQTGKQYILKMEHQVGKKMAARDRDGYDQNMVPRGGGKHGAQALGSLGVYAMLAHGSRANLREMQVLKSDKSQGGDRDELWGALQAGEVLPPPKPTFAYQKFNSYLKALGVDTVKQGNSLNLVPLTNKQVLDMSEGELKDPGRILKMRTLTPEKGGLFDEKITGGMDGKRWSHIHLSEPMPNPVFEKATMSLTGLRGPQFSQLIEGTAGVLPDGTITEELNKQDAVYGPKAVGMLLDKIDVDKKLAVEEGRLKNRKGQALNEANRRVKYLRNLKKLNMSPREAYMVENVPVLPPAMRPISIMEDGSLQTDDLNELYKGLGLVNQKMGEFPKGTPDSLKAPIAAATYDHLKALAGTGGTLNKKHPGILDTIAGKDGPKYGYAQATLIKRKQDMTARSTIVPEPSLSLDEAMIPRKAAKEMYKPFIVRELRHMAGATPLAARKMIEEDDPLARRALERVVAERPLLLKRDPVLHKYGIQAFRPKLTDGKAIKIHPLVCSGFNADFDGDQQLSQVLALLPSAVYNADRPFWGSREVSVSARFRTSVGYVENGHFVLCDLGDFPHHEEKVTKEHIDFHPVPAGVKVVALNELGGPCLAEVTGWSFHRQREVEIVTLGSGKQLFTDDDERAVYGLDASSLEWCRRRPGECQNQFVPVLNNGPCGDLEHIWKTITLPKDKTFRLKNAAMGGFDFGYFLGALVGDGWVSGEDGVARQVNLAASFPEVRDRWERASLSLFEELPTFTHTWLTEGKLGQSKGSGRTVLSCTPLASYVREWIGHGAAKKHLPPFFYAAPEEFLLGLLSGLWDTDGSASFSNAKSAPQFMFAYWSTSIRLVQEVQHLLRTFGVTATVTASKTPKGEPIWVLGVSIVELHDAQLGLKLAHPAKQQAYKQFLQGPPPSKSCAYSRNRLVPLPSALANELRGCIDRKEHWSIYVTLSKAVQRQYISKSLGEEIVRLVGPQGCSHPLFGRWVAAVQLPGCYFERVKSVEVTGIKEDGYDLTVPGYETFMNTGGVVLSNTMSAFVPIGNDAIKEAEKMFPSKNLFSPATHKVMYTPTHEQQVGLFMATQAGAATKEKFSNKAELEKAFNASKVKLTDVVTVGGVKTTLGRARVDSALPKALQGGRILKDLQYNLTKGEQGVLFEQVARADPKAYADTANAMKDIGNETASTEGFSFGLEDFKVHKDVRDPIMRSAASQAAKLDANKPADAQKIVDIYGKAMEKLEVGVRAKAAKQQTQLARLEIAAGIKGNGYRQLTAAPVLFVDGKGDVVPNPVTRSYSEGLATTDYWSATSGGRKGIIQKVQSVSEPGYLTKMMTNSVIDTVVDMDDCGTDRGVALSVDEPDIIGRYTTAEVSLGKGGKIPSNTLLTPDIVTRIKNNKASTKLVVRSPMRCTCGKGVCKHCMGLDENGQLPDKGTNVGILAAQAIGERGTQLAMKSFHCLHAKSLVTICPGRGTLPLMLSMEDLFHLVDAPVEVDEDGEFRRLPRGWLMMDGDGWTELAMVRRHAPTRPMVLVSDQSAVTICQDNHPIAVRENLVRCEECSNHRLKRPSPASSILNGKHYCSKCGHYQLPPETVIGDLGFLPPSELEPKRWYGERCLLPPYFCDDASLALDPYFVGAYLAEGCIGYRWTNPSNRVKKPYSISLTQEPGPIRDRILEHTSTSWNVRGTPPVIEIHSLELGQQFESLFGRYSRNVALPPDFVHYDSSWLATCLCGMIDGDGCVKADTDGADRIAIDTTSFELAQQIVVISARLGIVANLLPTSNRKLTRHQAFRVVLRITQEAKRILGDSIKVARVRKCSPDQEVVTRGAKLITNIRPVLYTDEFVYDAKTASSTFVAGGLLNHNSGGVYEGKSDTSLTAGGLDRATTLLYLPEKVRGSATLAPISGKVTKLTKDPAGGIRAQIGSTETYIPADRARSAKLRVGQSVRKGDPLTGGPVNPHELLPLAGISRTQGHLAGELNNIYGKYGIRRRNSEIMVRALSGVTKVEDPGGNSDLLPGDFTSTTQVYDWNKKHKGSPPVRHAPVLRGVRQIPLDIQEDWMARLNHEQLKSTMIEASQRGWSSDLHGLNPIPPLIHGTEFGKGTKDKPWRY